MWWRGIWCWSVGLAWCGVGAWFCWFSSVLLGACGLVVGLVCCLIVGSTAFNIQNIDSDC